MSSRLYIEPIPTESSLQEGAAEEELSLVAQYASEHRRREVLAWHAIVRRELGEGVVISHDEYGAPRVDTPNIHISVSHSRERVAVLLSESECAVDIEEPTRDFRKVAEHYLSDTERALAEQHDIFAEMWSAKEALYKYHRRGGLRFREDIKILGYDGEAGILRALLLESIDVEVKVARENGYVLATIG